MPVKPIIFKHLNTRQLLGVKFAALRLPRKIPDAAGFSIDDLARISFFQKFEVFAVNSCLKGSHRFTVISEKNDDVFSADIVKNWSLFFDRRKRIRF